MAAQLRVLVVCLCDSPADTTGVGKDCTGSSAVTQELTQRSRRRVRGVSLTSKTEAERVVRGLTGGR